MEAASTEELNSKITTLEKEKNKEEEYRNYMQLERVSYLALEPHSLSLSAHAADRGAGSCFWSGCQCALLLTAYLYGSERATCLVEFSFHGDPAFCGVWLLDSGMLSLSSRNQHDRGIWLRNSLFKVPRALCRNFLWVGSSCWIGKSSTVSVALT